MEQQPLRMVSLSCCIYDMQATKSNCSNFVAFVFVICRKWKCKYTKKWVKAPLRWRWDSVGWGVWWQTLLIKKTASVTVNLKVKNCFSQFSEFCLTLTSWKPLCGRETNKYVYKLLASLFPSETKPRSTGKICYKCPSGRKPCKYALLFQIMQTSKVTMWFSVFSCTIHRNRASASSLS